MSNSFWKPLLAAPAMLGAALVVSTAGAAQASEPSTSASSLAQVDAYVEGSGIDQVSGQVTSVSQLTDVKPTDWAFQALQSLVERYGCIVGYPDKTFRGNRALSRYEFAAGLNACMDRISELINAATADLVKKEDLAVVQKLQEEFAAELATLRGRVDALEVRTATLEKQQFSTTAKLTGEVIFAVSDTFGDAATRIGVGNRVITSGTPARPVVGDDNTETIFTNRVRLFVDASFSGKDQLRMRLAAANTTPFSGAFTGTNMTRLGFDGGTGANGATDNSVRIDKLWYRFPVGDNLRIQVDAINGEFFSGLVSPLSGPFSSDSLGTISRYGRFNPLTLRAGNPSGTSGGGAGFSFAYRFSSAFRLEGGFLSDGSSFDPGSKNGLFDGSYAAIGQLVITPTKGLDIGLSYVRSYYPGADVNLTSSTGSAYAQRPFVANATASDTFGASVQWYPTSSVLLGGWFGWTQAYQRSNNNEATIINWMAFLGFPDLLKKGNFGGIMVGMPPKVTDNDFVIGGTPFRREDGDSSIHVEGFYRYRITNNIAITPGLLVIFNPEHNSNNDTQLVGTLRTTFSF